MGKNTVLESTRALIETPQFVSINTCSIYDAAAAFSAGPLELPNWRMPAYPDADDKTMIDYFLLINTINFAFTDFQTGQKYAVVYKDTEWRGSTGMCAAITKAIDKGIPMLEGGYLSSIPEKDMKDIFSGSIEIPMLADRLRIFREVGKILSEKYSGHFHNVVAASKRRLFDDGKGLVERLTSDFPSFDDSALYHGYTARFDKRAQLAGGMLCGYFQDRPIFEPGEADQLTVFADYVVPKTLRDLGILKYESSLAEKVDTRQLISKNSLEELEIRASTIHSCKKLVDRINEIRGEPFINSLHLDYKLWSEGRKTPGQHHLTMTTAY
jgi:hypothetical protein